MTVGTDSDIELTHASVNGGAAVRFICKRKRNSPGVVTIQRQTYLAPDGTYTDILTFWMTILAGADLLEPDGSPYDLTRAQVHSFLEAFLAQRTGLDLETPQGTFTALFATLTHTTEFIGHDTDEITFALNNGAGDQGGPINWDRFTNSVWDGPLTWATSYWR